MNKNIIIAVLVFCVLVSLFFNSWQFYQHTHLDMTEPIYITQTDTFTIYGTDTIIKEKIKYVTKYDTITTRDIAINDTVYQITDTLEIPIEHKESEYSITNDSLKLHQTIYYQGFHTKIDSIQTDYEFNYTIQPPKQKQRKFHIALTAGMYCGYDLVDKGVYCGPGAGISFSYDLW